jgi:hypothetical protein
VGILWAIGPARIARPEAHNGARIDPSLAVGISRRHYSICRWADHVFFQVRLPQVTIVKMGAANDKNEGVLIPAERPNGFIRLPICVDCSPICESENFGGSSDLQSGTEAACSDATPGSFQFGGFRIPSFEIKQPERDNPTLIRTESATSSPHLMSSADILNSTKSPRSRCSVSILLTQTQDWNESQRMRLQLAVEEISRRMKIRPPGPRAMQVIMEARSKGLSAPPSTYNRM